MNVTSTIRPWIEVDYDEIIHDSGLAYLMRICDEKVWIPKRYCEDNIDFDKKTFLIPEWLAYEKGLT